MFLINFLFKIKILNCILKKIQKGTNKTFSCVYCYIVAVLVCLRKILGFAIVVCTYGKLGIPSYRPFFSMQYLNHFMDVDSKRRI